MRNRPLAVFLAFDAAALTLLAMYGDLSHPVWTAVLAGLLGVVAYMQWRGPRKG